MTLTLSTTTGPYQAVHQLTEAPCHCTTSRADDCYNDWPHMTATVTGRTMSLAVHEHYSDRAGTDENTWRKRLNYGIYCKNTMVRSNVRLVISIAREFEGPGMEFSDLIQEGMQGLVRGAEKFDASKGFRFSTYSHWWIKQAIRKSVLEQTQAQMADASSRAKECRQRLRRELKRMPTNEEIALDTGMDDGRLRTLHDIGQLMGVSRERIRQMEMGAFRKLRSKKRVESLQHYLETAASW